MQSVTLRYRVGEDGVLHLDVPIGLTNAELEVTVTFQPVTPTTQENIPQGTPGFFEETFGVCKDDPIVIDSEGIYEDGEELA